MFRRPIINTAVQILGKAVVVAIGLVATGMLTRRLGATVFGWFTLITSVFVLFDALADFGTRIIGVRELAKVRDSELRRQKWREILILRTVMAVLATMMGLIVVWSWVGFKEVRWEATVSFLMLMLTSVAGSLEIVFQTEMKMEKKVVMDILFPLLFLAWLVLWRSRVGLMVVFVGYLAARAMSLVVGVGLAKLSVLRFQTSKIKWQNIVSLLGESWPIGLYLIIFAAYDRAVDSLMIERLVGIREVAWYGLAYKIYLNLLQPAYFWVSSVFPLLAGEDKGKRRLFWGSLIILTVGVLSIIGIISSLAPMIIGIVGGADYVAAAGVLRILVWACLFSYVGHLLGFSLISKRGQGAMLKLGVTTLVFNVLANWWMIPRFGIYGAAGVTVATEALGCGLMGWSLWMKMKK